MSPPLDVHDSESILRYASLFTSYKVAKFVTQNAAPLYDWVNEAADRDDQAARVAALRRTYTNLHEMADFEPHDSPGAFLDEARIYYAALTGTGEPYLTIAPDHIPEHITTRVLGEIAGEVDDRDNADDTDGDTAE